MKIGKVSEAVLKRSVLNQIHTRREEVLLGASVTVLISLGFLFSMLYKITDKKLARVRYYLDVQRAGNNDTLTDGEQAEREALLNELAGASKVKKESKSTPAQGNDGADGE